MSTLAFREAVHPGIPVTLPEFHPEVALVQAGMELGNVDPRPHLNSTESEVYARRALLRSAMPPLDDVYVIKPLGGAEFVDVDTQDKRIDEHPFLHEIDVAADALVTTRRRIGLMGNMADCIDLVVAQPGRDILSLIHVGWKGAVYRIHEKVMDYATEEYGFDPKEAVAYLGPAVQKESFKLQWLHEAHESDPEWQPYVQEAESEKEEEHGFHIDIPGFVIATLQRYGIKEENIIANTVDTAQPDSGYFSYERHKADPKNVPDGRNGFMAALV
jgi:copper oxidase (laccase) domain-containing protein